MENLIDQAIYGKKKRQSDLRFSMIIGEDCIRSEVHTTIDGQIVSTVFNIGRLSKESISVIEKALYDICNGWWREASVDILAVERLENEP